MRRLRAGLGLRIFSGFAVVVGFMVLVSGVVFVIQFDGYRQSLDRSELRTAAAAAQTAVVRAVRLKAPLAEVRGLIAEIEEHSDVTLALMRADGAAIAAGGDAVRRWQAGEARQIARRAAEIDGGWYVADLEIDGREQPIAATVLPVFWVGDGAEKSPVVLAALWQGDARGAFRDDLVPLLFLSALAGIAAAAAIAALLSRSLVRPLQALTNVVGQFGAGRRDARAREAGASQVRDLAREFNSMADRVDANDRAMRGFIADVSHELRTPLTAIRGFSQALIDGDAPEERRQRSLEVIHAETRRILRMVQQLLDLSRLEAGQLELQLSDVSAAELIAHAADLFSQRAEEAGLALARNVAPDAPSIRGDFDRLAQVLNNLMDNALRHTAEGAITLTAGPAAEPGAALRIEVRDTGTGIDPGHLPRLFDRFWQLPDRSGPGAGLGLAISREIVRAHGGEISAESRPGEGAAFRISLPAEPPGGAGDGR